MQGTRTGSKEATEDVGQVIAQKEQEAVEAAWDVHSSVLPPLPEKIPERLYVSIDGTTVHTREEGWKEIKVGAFYTTTAEPVRVPGWCPRNDLSN
jgi:hypothetical protein